MPSWSWLFDCLAVSKSTQSETRRLQTLNHPEKSEHALNPRSVFWSQELHSQSSPDLSSPVRPRSRWHASEQLLEEKRPQNCWKGRQIEREAAFKRCQQRSEVHTRQETRVQPWTFAKRGQTSVTQGLQVQPKIRNHSRLNGPNLSRSIRLLNQKSPLILKNNAKIFWIKISNKIY